MTDPQMIYREATMNDIPRIQIVRHSVKENILSDPGLVTDDDCAEYLMKRGKGWVCEFNGEILGFAIADLRGNNIWALFVHPAFEKMGIGRKLHEMMLNWYFLHTKNPIWLSTAPATRAYSFYKKAGWIETGIHGKGEVKFEMTAEIWHSSRTGVI
jgi:GNAT superfamily N-acetyltransferase